jgi:dienelactone hydrolase
MRGTASPFQRQCQLLAAGVLWCAGVLTSAAVDELSRTALCPLPVAQDAAEETGRLEVPEVGTRWTVSDSLERRGDSLEDASECLAGLQWTPQSFEVSIEAVADGRGDRLVRFASPMLSGDETNDLVALEWYVARDSEGRPLPAPAVVIVHESGRGMTVGRIFARGLQGQQLHTFLIHLPGYGVRQSEGMDRSEFLLKGMQQAIADVRRAHDAVAALPLVDRRTIGVQGTSLGGFITATVAGVDDAYDRVFVLLAGGNLQKVVMEGQRDAAKVRERLQELGLDAAGIEKLTRPVEPLRLAHRIRPESFWLYSGRYDDVVPPECSNALAKAAGLPAEHHVELPADHYSGVVLLPAIIVEIARLMRDEPGRGGSALPDDQSNK